MIRPDNTRQYEMDMRLRGATLQVSAYIEVFLMNVIYYSNSKQYGNPIEPATPKTRHLTFGGKIKLAKDLLNEFHPDLLIEYKKLFEDLDKFLKIRNRMAHCLFEWLDEKCLSLNIWDNADQFAGKLRFFTPKKITTLQVIDSINDYFNDITFPVISLQNEVELRLKKNDPVVYSMIENEVNKVLKKSGYL